ncbi:MAG TPA: biopolymer transporter ExbD [Haliangiales bacterium]|nr:biopolymer transporter ExbD [Haliangiales bacterium]
MHAGKHGHHHRTATVHTTAKALADVRADINVTPLVDVCLVLLIIFMVVTDKLQRGMDVPLPQTKYHTKLSDTGEELIVSVTKDGATIRYFWDREVLRDLDTLKKRAQDELRRKMRPVYVKANADSNYGDVYPVLIALHEAGSPGVLLGTQELKGEAK